MIEDLKMRMRMDVVDEVVQIQERSKPTCPKSRRRRRPVSPVGEPERGRIIRRGESGAPDVVSVTKQFRA